MVVSFDQQKSEPDSLPVGWNSINHQEFVFGWSIGFPHTKKQTEQVDYVFNEIAVRAIAEEFEEDSDDDTEDDGI